jgi:hypothetical protein
MAQPLVERRSTHNTLPFAKIRVGFEDPGGPSKIDNRLTGNMSRT